MVNIPSFIADFNLNVAKSIFEGVLKGFTEREAPDILECLKDGENSFNAFKTAVSDFEKKSLSGVKAGLGELAKGLDGLKQALTDCGDAKKEIEALLRAMSSLRSPWELAYHVGKELVVNGRDIFRNVEDASSNFKSQSWFNFGEDIGKIIADLAGVDRKTDTDVVPKMTTPIFT